MKSLHLKRIFLFLFVLGGFIGKMNGQITPSAAGYLDAVADYGADPTGGSVTTSALQNAINGAISQGKALFIPEGTYLIDGSLRVNCDAYESHEKPVIIAGSSVDASKRTTLLLKSGTFTDPVNPGTMLMSEAWTGANADTYDRVIQSVDFKIEDNNSGAIALNWRGAEGCGIFDVNIDVTGGFRGMLQAPGSGGSTVDVTVIGGVIGIDLSGTDLSGGGTQPTPVFTHLTLIGQTGSAFKTNWNRGSVVITGAHIVLNPGVNAFHGMKPNMFQYYPGGNLLLTDSKIEYTSYDPSNLAFYFFDAASDNGVNFNNVYVKNADRIIDHDFTVNSNKDGWTHFRELAYGSGSETFNQGVVHQNVYLEGVNQGGVYEDSQIATEIPSNLVSYHGWGETFPSFETPGVINIADYSDLVINGDWAPAFNQAIADATGGSETVFVPSGDYEIYSTIELGLHTRLIGVSSFTSRILGYDMDGQRFGGSEDPYGDSRPMIQTQENISADNILADIAVRPVGAFNLASHNPTPTPHYALLWRAGRHSIIRNILTEHYKGSEYFRPSNCFNTLKKSTWLSLHSIASPTTIGGLTFSSDSKSQFFNYTELPSRIWLETVSGSQRLMARSHSPNNVANTTIKKPNIILEKGGNTFTINSLEVSNAAWNSAAGHDVVIEGYSGDSKVQEEVVLMTGLNKPRENHEAVTLGWTGITKVIIKSESMFSIDNVTVDGAIIDFESVIGTEPAADVDYASALYYDTARDLPLSMIYNHLSIITGGVKWYNHWKHGDTWMAPEKAYVAVLNNTEPVNFYHFHAQHSQNDQKVYLENARDVSIFGIKTENTTYFLKAFNSNNIRVFGHGGLTNPAPPSSHYYFDNTSNYMVASVSDELNADDDCMYCGSGNALLIKAAFGSYDVIKDVTDQAIITPERADRPILWQKGNPSAAYLENCTATQPLTVVNGSGSGDVCVGSAVNVIAEKLDCKTFLQWTGDVQYLNDSTSSTTSFFMPDEAVTIEAVYEDKPMYTVSIEGGSGSGSYCANQLVEISAEPVAGDVFVSWIGSTGELSDVTLANQSFSMPESDLSLSATFKTNLAYNKPATALTERVDKGRYAPLATDGDNTTRWESEFSDPQWITVDLGAVTTFNEVGINWEAAYATAYQVQISNDNQTWTDIFSTNTGDGGYDLISTDSSARYIRVYCTERVTPWGYSIYEIEVFGAGNVTGVLNEKKKESFEVYLNPSNDILFINGNHKLIEKLQLYNLSGQLLKDIRSIKSDIYALYLNDVKNGFYILLINGEEVYKVFAFD